MNKSHIKSVFFWLDNYGWLGYRAPKFAKDPRFAVRGYHVPEMPTGQGMAIKQK